VKRESAREALVFRRKIFLMGVTCLFLIVVVTSIFGRKGVMEIHSLRRDLAKESSDVLKLRQQKSRLESEIKELESNPRAVEKEARRTLWLVKPGEKTIVVPKDVRK
jgi:cell division protein FtsB